jgi:mono/diheme cytochrome c family protein
MRPSESRLGNEEANMNKNTTHSIAVMLGKVLACSALAALGAGLAGCRGDRDDKAPRQFFPDMDEMPRWTPQSQSEFFPDHRTMRQPVTGAVAFSRSPMSTGLIEEAPQWATPFLTQRGDLLKENGAYFTGKNADGSFVDVMPEPPTKDTLLLGQAKYTIYCAVCHGHAGDGRGMVGDFNNKERNFTWSYALPNYHDAKYRMQDPADAASQKHKDGFLFDTARNGVADASGMKMPGYKHALSESESWAVVAYIRALQRSHLGTAGDLPEATRQAVDAAATTGGRP